MPHDYDRYRTHHASRRLRGYDYARPGVYFITLCTHDRGGLFGEIVAGQMRLNAAGQIVDEEWRRSETVRAEIMLDEYVVMPNHVHGLVVIAPPGGDAPNLNGYDVRGDVATVASSGRTTLPDGGAASGPPPKSLGSFVAGFKAAATGRINAARGTPGAKVWQARYHDRIVRDEKGWRRVRRYIRQNPAQWGEDRNNPARL